MNWPCICSGTMRTCFVEPTTKRKNQNDGGQHNRTVMFLGRYFVLFLFLGKTLSFPLFFSPGLSLTINRNDQKEPPEATPCDLMRGSSHVGRTRKSWTLVSSLTWMRKCIIDSLLWGKTRYRSLPLGVRSENIPKPSVKVPAWGWDLIKH